MPQEPDQQVELSLIAPAHNEQDNIAALVEQSGAAMASLGILYEFLIVDDGSTKDDTAA